MLTLTWNQWQALIEHAEREAPHEACGVLVGQAGRVVAVQPMRNAEASPVRYALDPQEQLKLLRRLEEEGQELVAIYHSHVASEAYPSATDVALAFWEESYYVIISLARQPPSVRAFRIVEGKVAEVEIQLAGG